ncbi:histidine ammonia-lyase [Caballeronia sp. LZ029]|uniref:histidine ammonia-lyase n=1 Tax=Caballeronia sp. LZ029 TaxID=3038564 RepID=UPI0028621F4B|nr:histidine ammonia-lyase [Caballeronia sp. LZ029]MDR5743280.1 histidine ammonia-lyase [Caballeronia sp. LZ029]
MNRLPINGQRLLDMRRRKQRPAGVTLISFVGWLPYSNFQLSANPTDSVDWTPIAGLEIDVMVSRAMPFSAVVRQLGAIALAAPDHMVLSYVEGPRVDCGQARYSLQTFNPNTGRMLFDWFPMAVGVPHIADAIKLERRLWHELGRSLPIPFDDAERRILTRMKKEAAWPK